jgi:hypothetical protein
MAMMESIRRSTDSAWMKIIFGIIVLVFVFWGIGATGPTNTEVAKVNGTRITDTELHREMRKINTTGAQNEDDLRALQQEVIQRLIRDEVLFQEAERLGLEVSTTEIGLYLKRMESSDGSGLFSGPDGTFDEELYKTFLERQGYKQSAFEGEIQRKLLRRKLAYLAMSSVTISDAQVWDLYSTNFRQLGYSVVQVNWADLHPLIEINEESLATWLLSNQATVDSSILEQQNLYKFEIAEELLDQADGTTIPSEDENLVEVENEGPIGEEGADEERALAVQTFLGEHSEEVDAIFDERRTQYANQIAEELMTTELLKTKAKELADELRLAWEDGTDAFQAKLAEVNTALSPQQGIESNETTQEEEGNGTNEENDATSPDEEALPEAPPVPELPPVLTILSVGEHYLNSPPLNADDPTALQAWFAVEGNPSLAQELLLVDTPGVLAESKPTNTGWQIIHLDTVNIPTREEFDSAVELTVGVDPTTNEPVTVDKEEIRFKIWYGQNPQYSQDYPCKRVNQSGQPVKSTGEACLFYDRWVNDLMARAEIEQLFIP